MDEPTSALSEDAAERLFEVIGVAESQGRLDRLCLAQDG